MLDSQIDGIIEYIEENRKSLFAIQNYESAPPEYIRLNL